MRPAKPVSAHPGAPEGLSMPDAIRPDTTPISEAPPPAPEGLTSLTLQELKRKPPAELLEMAESLEVENANNLRSQDMMFAILKELADRGVEIGGGGVIEILPDGFGFLRSPQSNYLPGP